MRLLCAGGAADGTWRELEPHVRELRLPIRPYRQRLQVGANTYTRHGYTVAVHHEDGTTDLRDVELLVWDGMSATDCDGTLLGRRLHQLERELARQDGRTVGGNHHE